MGCGASRRTHEGVVPVPKNVWIAQVQNVAGHAAGSEVEYTVRAQPNLTYRQRALLSSAKRNVLSIS